MRKLNQSGTGVVEVLLVILVIAILGITGWFVWHSRQAADKTYKAANTVAQSVSLPKADLSLNKAAFPRGWSVALNRSDEIELRGPDFSAVSGCSLTVVMVKDTAANAGDHPFGQKQHEASLTTSKNKGYTYTEYAPINLAVNLNGKQQTVQAFHDLYVMADGTNPLYEANAYLAGNGVYAQIQAICHTDDVASVTPALAAITIRLPNS